MKQDSPTEIGIGGWGKHSAEDMEVAKPCV